MSSRKRSAVSLAVKVRVSRGTSLTSAKISLSRAHGSINLASPVMSQKTTHCWQEEKRQDPKFTL